jgi:hypothetical protein
MPPSDTRLKHEVSKASKPCKKKYNKEILSIVNANILLVSGMISILAGIFYCLLGG